MKSKVLPYLKFGLAGQPEATGVTPEVVVVPLVEVELLEDVVIPPVVVDVPPELLVATPLVVVEEEPPDVEVVPPLVPPVVVPLVVAPPPDVEVELAPGLNTPPPELFSGTVGVKKMAEF